MNGMTAILTVTVRSENAHVQGHTKTKTRQLPGWLAYRVLCWIRYSAECGMH